MLETRVEIPHEYWGILDTHTHESVTEFEVCEEWCVGVELQYTQDEINAERLTEQFYEGSGPFSRDEF